jgi:hypothetical protein
MAARPSPAELPQSNRSTRASDSRSSFARLSLIAIGCFAVGLSWPLLTNLQFVQRPPGSTPKAEEREPPPLDVSSPEGEPEKSSRPPPPAQRSPLTRDLGVRAAAKAAPVASERARPSAGDAANELVVMRGQATIGWKAAVVRKGPSGQAETVERVLYGTRVSVTGRQGEWYRVKYGRKGQSGWVHRKALGL